jgi:hypothetical protein
MTDDQVRRTPGVKGMCGSCYDEGSICPARCQEKPEELTGAIGMYHCSDCGAMVMAGMTHPWLCEECQPRLVTVPRATAGHVAQEGE